MDHGHALFAHAAGGGFQVQLRCHRDDEDEIISAGPLGHQCFIHAGGVFPYAGGYRHAVHRYALLVGVFMGGIGHLGPLQNAHGIGLCFFSHSSITPIGSYSTTFAEKFQKKP